MQFCVLFIVALSLVAPDLFPACEVTFPHGKFAFVLLLPCLVVMSAALIVMSTQRDVDGQLPEHPARQRLARLFQLHLGLWCIATLSIFFVLDWSRLLQQFGWSTMLVRVLSLSTVLFPLLLSWAFLYDAEKAMDNANKTRTSHGRWKYVWRHSKRYVLIPVFVLMAAAVWSDAVNDWTNHRASFTTVALQCAPLPLLALLFPVLLRFAQAKESIPSSPIRERIDHCCKNAGYEPADVLIWNTDHSMRNAALTGFFARQSYLLITDRLLSEVPTKRIEMIVLHEIAHARHAHHWKLFFSTTIWSCGCVSLYWSGVQAHSTLLAWGITLLAAASGILVFSQLARLFELEADLYAANLSGNPVEYLRAIADIAGGHPDRSTWMHPSFQRRCEFLLNEVENGRSTLRWEMQSVILQMVIWVCVVTAVATVLAFAW